MSCACYPLRAVVLLVRGGWGRAGGEGGLEEGGEEVEVSVAVGLEREGVGREEGDEVVVKVAAGMRLLLVAHRVCRRRSGKVVLVHVR